MSREFDSNDTSEQDARRARKAAKSLRDILRKTFAQSGDARQTTEELLRAILGEVKVPREYVNVILQQINATRDEIVRVVAGEVRTFLDDANLGEEIAKILTSLSFEIRTEIRFIPNDEALKPSVKSRVGIKSARDSDRRRAPAPVPPHPAPAADADDDDEDFIETRGSAAIDKAIQKRVASLANLFLKGLIDVDDAEDFDASDDEEVHSSVADAPDVAHATSMTEHQETRDEPSSDEAFSDILGSTHAHERDEAQRRSGFNPLKSGDFKMRMPLAPDIRRRAEAAASQVATASRVTASLSAAATASAVSAAANRAQAVVRGSRNLTNADARDQMWKKWVGIEEPDLVGNPVIGAPAHVTRAESQTPLHTRSAVGATRTRAENTPAPTPSVAEAEDHADAPSTTSSSVTPKDAETEEAKTTPAVPTSEPQTSDDAAPSADPSLNEADAQRADTAALEESTDESIVDADAEVSSHDTAVDAVEEEDRQDETRPEGVASDDDAEPQGE